MFYILWFIIWAIIGAAAGQDATRRGKSAVLVFLLVLLGGPVGFINWVLFRPEMK